MRVFHLYLEVNSPAGRFVRCEQTSQGIEDASGSGLSIGIIFVLLTCCVPKLLFFALLWVV